MGDILDKTVIFLSDIRYSRVMTVLSPNHRQALNHRGFTVGFEHKVTGKSGISPRECWPNSETGDERGSSWA